MVKLGFWMGLYLLKIITADEKGEQTNFDHGMTVGSSSLSRQKNFGPKPNERFWQIILKFQF